ncbi:MAG: hypothetical protein NXI32_21995 [bacterium]|nr:hypothetical protein [bacterium]
MEHVEFYDPRDSVTIYERKLPHWSQAGTLCFITFRTFDSLPVSVIKRFHADRRNWLRLHGVNPDAQDCKERLAQLDKRLREEFWRTFSERWNLELDACQGECHLRRPEFSKIVADSLHHFENDRYLLTDYVVMPNHVHLLAAFPTDEAMLLQCESWKHFTATQINRLLGRKGRFWQQDGFDHLVRSLEEFEYYRGYILNNPSRAGLQTTDYRHYSAQ